MDVRGLFDFVQKVTDLDRGDIARGIGVPELMLRNVLKHPAPWGLVPGPEVVSRLALAAKAISTDHGPEGGLPWLHLSNITEIEVMDPFGGGINLCGTPSTLAEEIDLDVREVLVCKGVPLWGLLSDNTEALRKYAEWLCGYCAALEGDGLLPAICWADWAPVPGVDAGVARSAAS